jgi:F-type H+-transporting ATPase subunit b
MTTMKRFAAILVLLAAAFTPAKHVFAQAEGAGSRAGSPEVVSPQANQEEKDENDAYRHSAMVKKIGGMMGMSVDAAATTFEIINFAVLALALGFAAAKILPKTFRDRNSAIQKDLVDARTATEEATARLNSVEDRLAKLDGQIAEMRAQAEKDVAAEEQRARAAIETERGRILASAEQEIASASMMAQRSLQKYAAELAIEQAARKLVVSAETDRLLVQGFARRLTGEDENGGQN